MKKRVWMMNHYAGNMFFGQGGRHYNFAKYLKQAGYEPVVFCANSKHNAPSLWFENHALWQEHPAEEIGVPFVFVRARTYTGNGKQRILNMLDFYKNVQRAAVEYAAAHGRPDIIYASSVHPLTLVAGLRLAKRFGVQCICEVRDLWPEAIVTTYPDRFSRKNPLIRLLYQGEKWIYKKADAVIFTWEGAYGYILENGWEREIPRDKVFYINNGVDLEAFDCNRERFRFEDRELDDPSICKVVYTGAIRRVNELGVILDMAKEVQDRRVRFLLWGDGDELPALRQRAEEEGIDNVAFKGAVEKQYIPSIISRADLNLEHWQRSALLKYGTSHNKLFEYLAAGRPIFSTIQPSYSVIKSRQCGLEAEGESAAELAEGLQRLLALPAGELERMGENARRAAEEYDFKFLTERLIGILENRGNR